MEQFSTKIYSHFKLGNPKLENSNLFKGVLLEYYWVEFNSEKVVPGHSLKRNLLDSQQENDVRI